MPHARPLSLVHSMGACFINVIEQLKREGAPLSESHPAPRMTPRACDQSLLLLGTGVVIYKLSATSPSEQHMIVQNVSLVRCLSQSDLIESKECMQVAQLVREQNVADPDAKPESCSVEFTNSL